MTNKSESSRRDVLAASAVAIAAISVSTNARAATAASVKTQFVETKGRKLAYRKIGSGPALVLCLRFRGVMDSWDPKFLDLLARKFTVITFDYSGLGQSTGTPSYQRKSLAQDAKDLVDALGLKKVIIGGWSLGGMAAQIFAALYPQNTSHAILIGTTPPGPQPHTAEAIFLEYALKPVNTLEDEYVLFFEPTSELSKAAANASHKRIAARTTDRSPAIPEATYMKMLAETSGHKDLFHDDGGYASTLMSTTIPLLSINGDHDIVFPVENWYALNRQWKSLHIITFPQSGHGPQHQFPEVAADTIISFVSNIKA